MSIHLDSKYTIYKPEALPSGLFGETYVVAVGIYAKEKKYKGEYFVITQRPKPTLFSGGFEFSADDFPQDFLTVDLDFLVQESRQQAEIRLIDRLEQLSEELKKPDLLALQVRLVENNMRPFVGCWLRGSFHEQIRQIAKTTECQSLSIYLSAVSAMASITHNS
jgi:hypothetical protein